MYRKLLLMTLLGLCFTACKPTERKVVTLSKHRTEQSQPEQKNEADPGADAQAEKPATPAGPVKETPPVAEAQEQAFSDCLLEANIEIQKFNQIRPWEKEQPGRVTQSALYLGDGRVLVVGVPLRAATYAELRLPDGSRAATARILKYDADLGMGLLTVAHNEDSAIFDTRKAYPLGEPLKLGDNADLWCLISDTMPAHVALHAESGKEQGSMPRICMKAASALPGNIYGQGAPVIKDGKLVAVTNGYDQGTLSLSCINADLIKRFLDEENTDGAPVLGMSVDLLEDPVFRRYLNLKDSQTGLYISKVEQVGAAAEAGIRKGDVLVAIEGMPVDSQGRCAHPLYGPLDAACVASSLKPTGQTLRVTIIRDGESKEVDIPLNRDAKMKGLIGTNLPGVQPRYILWGGLLFQPITHEYLQALRAGAGGLPVQYLTISRREEELRKKGVTELVALSGALPTPATHGYEKVGGCLVEKINGTPVMDFRQFTELLGEATPDGVTEISIDRPPYTIYIDNQNAAATDEALRHTIYNLRNTGGGD